MITETNNTHIKKAVQLFQALNDKEISYCHWKSNIRLDKSLQGKTDFDLLVDRRQALEFRRILFDFNSKPLVAAPGRQYPAMEHYLGFDDETGRLFHLHVHYQLVLGEQFVKNYRLPIESRFLASTQIRSGIKTPSTELELIVLSIRVLLKYRDRDALKDLIPFRSPGLSYDFREEIKWLLSQTSLERIVDTLSQLSWMIQPDLILDFLKIAIGGEKAGLKLYRMRNRIRRDLSLFQRNDPFSATATYFRETWNRRSLLRSEPITKMTLPQGGLTLALIGADGAGKSTLTSTIINWLSWKADIRTYYLGSKQPSRASQIYYSIFRMIRRMHGMISRVVGERNLLSSLMFVPRDYFLAKHYLSIARDRYTRYVAGGKRSMAGSVILFDRYPLTTFMKQGDLRLMDGPQIPFALNSDSLIARLYARKEKAFYDAIRIPDALIVLDVSPEMSQQRKPDHDRDVVEIKSKTIRNLIETVRAENKIKLVHIDADLPLDQVTLQLKTGIWNLL